MGSGYTLACDKCGHSVNTSGPWEFYRDKKGKLKDYGHPTPASKAAEAAGIAGLRGSLYCPACDKVSVVILVEFKKPTTNLLDAWSSKCEPQEQFKDGKGVRCPSCQGSDLLLSLEDGKKIGCPHCKDGQMVCQMDWIS